ncbi:MAG: hypothetical protein QOH10_413, partial [Actinomycetota bacterium]|nr:hypothetical protein [Actinomycetota bacterium]
PGEVVADLEDDFHHFRVTLRHDDTNVRSVESESIRWPWSTCPDAATPLLAIAGAPLTRRFTHLARWTNPAMNCTHQFDAAAHAVTHAAWGRSVRQYDVEVGATFRRHKEVGRNRLWVDGKLVLEWHLQPWRAPVELPAAFADAPWRGGFLRWADEHLEPDAAEQACVLRRATDIGMGRGMPLDDIPVASELPSSMRGVCHAMQPEIVTLGLRHVGSIRDFAATPERLGHDE